ncbi:MAG: hypothetical protein ED559_05110 [Phycisphaera sp.]|nr:MAG: hypothetical protein ED559_05110 [Phycisphaera sp.]
MSPALPRSRVAAIPSEACFWSVLDASATDGLRGKTQKRALLYALEPDLPVPIDEVEALFRAEPNGAITACACRRDRLEDIAKAADIAVPDSVPSWLETSHVASNFDLLQGSIVSGRSRHARRTLIASVFVVGLIISSMLMIGFLNRTKAYNTQRDDAASATSLAQELVLPPAGPNSQPASIRLAAMLRSTSTHKHDNQDNSFTPASESLEQILSIWPDGARLQRLSVGKQDVRVDLSMPIELDPTNFIEHLETLEGWSLSAPSIRRTTSTTSVSVSLQRKQEAR